MADRFPIIIESTEQQIQELSAGDGLDLTKSGVVNANYVHSAGVNAGVVTATSFIGDGSQITNIPAGGGSLEATASGTLSDGSKVIVNTDGTVSVVARSETTEAGVYSASKTVFESGEPYYTQSAFVGSGKIVIVYRDQGNSYYGTAVVGTVSGTSISFGTPVVFESATTQHTSTVYDSANDKVVIVYSDNGDASRGTAVVGTISGTSISFGTPVAFRSSSCTYNSAAYDSASGKIVVAYQDGGNSDRGYTSVLTVSGTSITYGSYRQFESGRVDSIGTAYDSVNEKVVIAYQDGGNSDYGKAVVATISGTENTFGTPVTFESAGTSSISAVYDSSNQKVVIAYKDAANSYKTYSGTAIVGTVSGTSISFGTPTVFALSPNDMKGSLVYDSTDQKVIIAYGDARYGSDRGTIKVGTVSGTSISFGNSQVFDSDTTYYSSPVYDPTNDKVIIAYKDQGNSGYGTGVVLSPDTISTNLTSENYIGISDGAYSNGQTATIQLIGSVDDAQSSLTPGQKYYVQDDGTLAESGSVLAGTAIASTKLLIKK